MDWSSVKIFYDCEFLEAGPKYPIELISIGMVADNGDELYAINEHMPIAEIASHPWLRENVLPHLPQIVVTKTSSYSWQQLTPEILPRETIAHRVSKFIADHREHSGEVELWAWYGAYDHVVMAQLFNTMTSLPHHIPKWTNDLRQETLRLEKMGHSRESLRFPNYNNQVHHALADARELKMRYKFLREEFGTLK